MDNVELQQKTAKELESLLDLVPKDVDPNAPLSEEIKAKLKERTEDILNMVENA